MSHIFLTRIVSTASTKLESVILKPDHVQACLKNFSNRYHQYDTMATAEEIMD